MPQLEFFLLSESVSVDQSTNRLSLFNIIEEMKAIILPREVNVPRDSLPQIFLVSSWNIDPSEFGTKFQIEFKIHRPGAPNPEEVGRFEFVAERRKQRIIQLLIGCPLSVGETRFEVLLGGIHQANHLVSVLPPDKPPEPKPAPGDGSE